MMPDAVFREANALFEDGRLDEAAALYDQLLEKHPEHAGALSMLGLLDLQRRRFDSALAYADRAFAVASGLTPAQIFDVLHTRASILRALGRRIDAIAACNAALEIDPDSAEIFALRGLIFKESMQLERSLADLEAAIELDSHLELIHGEAIQVALQSCEWEGFAHKVGDLLARVDAGQYVVQPYILSFLPSSPAQQLKAASQYFARNNPVVGGAVHLARSSGEKLRIGYFSSDYHDHPTSQLMVEILKAHDRAQFEVFAFSFGGVAQSPMRKRVLEVCDRFTDVFGMSDDEAAALARAQRVHIAVDLNGFTALSRPGIFAAGAAPLQVNYLGYPGTLGNDRYDYIIGDDVVTPAEHRSYFAERTVVMPHSYQPNTGATRTAIAQKMSREEAGLPPGGLVFCCFNSVNKITPDVFDIWMRLLKEVEGSVLWLLEGAPVAMRNLRREAKTRGVSPERIIFAPRRPVGIYLARYAHADIFLDTLYYNGHTTGSDALLMNVPVVTRLGDAFAARVGASLLAAVGLPELIAKDADGYERLALELARDATALRAVRRKLADNLQSAPLFDAGRYTRNLETAYKAMSARHEQGLSPDHITVREPG
jgi:protein O-GlcNAc transferase